jgi:hypothetical protein
MSCKFSLEGITKSFSEWVNLGICPDCGGDLDINDECPGWYDRESDVRYNLSLLVGKDLKDL